MKKEELIKLIEDETFTPAHFLEMALEVSVYGGSNEDNSRREANQFVLYHIMSLAPNKKFTYDELQEAYADMVQGFIIENFVKDGILQARFGGNSVEYWLTEEGEVIDEMHNLKDILGPDFSYKDSKGELIEDNTEIKEDEDVA